MLSTTRLAAIAAAIFLFGLSAPATAQTQNFTCDCTRGQTISDALERGDSRKPLVLTVRGTCNENVLIKRDDVTLQGDSATGGAIVNGPDAQTGAIRVQAMRIVIDRLTVTGGYNGISVYGASDVRISNTTVRNSGQNGMAINNSQGVTVNSSTLQDSGQNGIAISNSQGVTVNSSTLKDATQMGMSIYHADVLVNNSEIASNKQAGVHLGSSAVLRANGNTIKSNWAHGLGVFNGSTAMMWGNTIQNNGFGENPVFTEGVYVYFGRAEFRGGSITGNAGAGIVVVGSSSIFNNTISGNGVGNNGGGVTAYVGAVLLIDGSNISENIGTGVQLDTNVTSQISNFTNIQNNSWDGISLALGSKLKLTEPTYVTGNGGWGVNCVGGDADSRVYGLSLIDGSVSPACTGVY